MTSSAQPDPPAGPPQGAAAAEPDEAAHAERHSKHLGSERARERVEAARERFERTWLDDLIKQVRALDMFGWTAEFGAEMLWSLLPLLILLSSLADVRIDDDLSRHIGLDNQGARIVSGLFRSSPSHAFIPIATGLLISFAGTIAVIQTMQVLYERVFELEPRGWRDLPRFVLWLVVVLAVLVAQGISTVAVRTAVGPVLGGVLRFIVVTIFFAWTIHFLLAGRVPWRLVIRPALATGLLWIGVAVFSSIYFSSAVVSDSKDYGPIGVIFTFLTWFILIGVAILLGAVLGAFWQARSAPREPTGA